MIGAVDDSVVEWEWKGRVGTQEWSPKTSGEVLIGQLMRNRSPIADVVTLLVGGFEVTVYSEQLSRDVRGSFVREGEWVKLEFAGVDTGRVAFTYRLHTVKGRR